MPHASLTLKREILSGTLMAAIGLAAMVKGRDYGLGTLTKMGAGFLPVTLGAILALLGLLILLSAFRGRSSPMSPNVALGVAEEALEGTDWRGVLCILGGMGGFIAMGSVAGLIPASIVCVFVSALGDRTASFRSAAILAACVTTASTLIFYFGLGIRFPLLPGW